MDLEDEAGYFAVLIPGKRIPNYVYHVTYEDGSEEELLDPYIFAPQITEKKRLKNLMQESAMIFIKSWVHIR